MKMSLMFLIHGRDPNVPFRERYREVFRQLDAANGHGFECAWFTEHHFSDYGYTPNPIPFMSEAAHVAPEMRVGSAVFVLPLWHPLRLAEDIAVLDQLTDGRVDVGIGRGYQRYESERLGADLAESRDQFSEALNIMLDAWTKDDFEYDGRYHKLPRTTVFPKPLQEPHPPIWMAATTPPSIRAAVERGYHLCTGTGAVFEELAQRNAYIDTLLERMGRPSAEIERATVRFTFCSTSEDEIKTALECSQHQTRVSRVLSAGTPPVRGRNNALPYAGEPDLDSWERRLVIGDPDTCIEQIQGLADAGITYVQAQLEFGGLDHDLVMRSFDLFCKEAMPTIMEITPRQIDREQRAEMSEAYATAESYYQGA